MNQLYSFQEGAEVLRYSALQDEESPVNHLGVIGDLLMLVVRILPQGILFERRNRVGQLTAGYLAFQPTGLPIGVAYPLQSLPPPVEAMAGFFFLLFCLLTRG